MNPISHSKPTLSLAALVAAATALAASPAAAQQTLPGIVVQGASIEARPAPRKPAADAGGTAQSRQSGAATGSSSASTSGSTGGAAAGGSTGAVAGVADRNETVSGLPADKTGTSVSVVTREDLLQRQVRTGAEALRALPGVSVSRQGGPQSVSVVRIRGAESNHTLVLIDGVEVNSGTDGFFDFSNLLVEDIERIEVLRGPQSGLYGSSAVGGVINIITRQGKGPLTVQARVEGGSFRTYGGAVSVSGGTDRMHGILSLYGSRSDGYNLSVAGSEADFANFSNMSFSGGFKVFDNLKIDGTLRHSSTTGGYDSGFGGVLRGFDAPSDAPNVLSSDLWVGRVAATLDSLDGRWVNKAFYGRMVRDLEATDVSSFGTTFSESWSANTKYGLTSTYRLDGFASPKVRHYITGQIERQDEQFEQATRPQDGKKERSQIGAVGEIRGEYFDVLNLQGTVRRDDNDTFDDFTTWRASGSLKVPATIFRLHASIGTAVKYPSFGELFGFFSTFRPNSSLVAEESQGWDAGVEMSFLGGRAVIDVTYFDQNLENEIETVSRRDANGRSFFTAVNLDGESTRKGIEVQSRFQVTPEITVGGAYTYLLAREFDTTLRREREEVRRAPHSGRADLNWAFMGGRGNFNVAAIYNGRMTDFAFDARTFDRSVVTLDAYWLVTVGASYKVTQTMELYGRLENAFDQNYQEVFGFETPGFAAYGGVKFTYEDPSTAAWAIYK